ncbi:MAG: ADP-glyceromanno-heptose 6-epimerase [Micavibrio sp.]|nr:ADP-glyceromanno-heptose 6-epimerase [Micavibrio sp.]|tara:strand:- start:530 stop:1531 length:1002 start_codon:yes stop_codon:yes gene_type:complete
MIVVTGGAGFIGSNLVATLEENGISNVVICDVLGNEDKWRNIGNREIRDFVAPGNLMTYLDQHADEVEMLFHLGAISSTTEQDADSIINNNFILSRELWKWCAQNDVRFLYASSYSVYGNGDTDIGFRDDDSPEALAKLKPLNAYGWSKNVFDRRVSRIVHSSDKTDPLPPQWVGLRMFNVYGPNEYHKGEHMSVVSKLHPQVAAGAAARLFKSYSPKYEDGGQIRDFIWVQDCVDVMLWFYQNQDKSGLFNLGTGKGRSFKDMAEAMFKAYDKPSKITYVDMPNSLKSKYQYYTEADVSKLRAAGYTKEFTSLEDGIKLYVDNYLSKDDQYR